MENKLDKNFRMKAEDYEQMKFDIRNVLNNVDEPLSYLELAEQIGSTEYTVINMIGIYFKDLTGDALKKVASYSVPDDDFYLYFNKLKHINDNKQAQRLFNKMNKQIDRNFKVSDVKRRLIG